MPRPAPPPGFPAITLRDRRAAALDRAARAVCTTRLATGLGISREAAALVLDDVLHTYQQITGGTR